VSSQGSADAYRSLPLTCLLFNVPAMLRLQLHNRHRFAVVMLHQPRLPGTSNIGVILRHFTLDWTLL